MKFSYKSRVVVGAILVISFSSQIAQALPDLKRSTREYFWSLNSKMPAFYPEEGNTKLIHVLPKPQLVQGTYAYDNDGPSTTCANIYRQREVIYRYPAAAELPDVIKSNNAYSVAFEANTGIIMRQFNLVREYQKLITEYSTYLNDTKITRNRDGLTETISLNTLEAELTTATNDKQLAYNNMNDIKTSLDDLKTKLAKGEKKLDQQYQDKIDSIDEQIDKIYDDESLTSKERREKIKELKEEKKEIEKDWKEAQKNFEKESEKELSKEEEKYTKAKEVFEKNSKIYNKAYERWTPYQKRANDFRKEKKEMTTDYNNLQSLMEQALERSEKTLTKLQSAYVGKVSVGYNVFNDELSNAREVLEGTGWSAQQMPIFNVRSNGGVHIKNKENKIDQSIVYSGKTIAYPENTINFFDGPVTNVLTGFTSNFVSEPAQIAQANGAPTPKKDANEQLLYVNMMQPNVSGDNSSSGAFDKYVTLGATCGQPIEETYSYKLKYKDYDGNIKTSEFSGTKYNTDHKHNVFNETVALRYNYYVRAEPMNVSCSINSSTFHSYVQNKGRTVTDHWFEEDEVNEWDNVQESLYKDMGIRCDSKFSPTGKDSLVYSNKDIMEMEQVAMKEVMAQYVISHATSYTIDKSKTVNLPTMENNNSHSYMAYSFIALCGGEIHCTIGAIVFKGVTDNYGVRATGSASNTYKDGDIVTYDFSRTEYRIVEGSTYINLVVPAPNNNPTL